MATLSPSDIERFRGLVAHRFGLNFDDTRLGFLAEVLRARVDATDVDNSAYLSGLDTRSSDREEWRLLAGALTVPETYFFRNVDQFHAFKDVALAERIQRRSDRKTLRFLSAGCASGEEA
jgi:chemotaxis protein methyltransferase CheR